MNRRLLSTALVLIFVFISQCAWAANYTVEQVVQQANQELGLTWYDINQVNKDVWNKYHILVYEQPYGTTAIDGEQRYLGKTPLGEPMPNPDFPPDDPASTVINNWDWQNPFDFPNNQKECTWDNQPASEPYITAALSTKYGALFNTNQPPQNAKGWYKITKILQPRTGVTPGLGRLWHNWNNAPWYITVVIPAQLPKTCDIEAVAITRTSPVHTGTRQVSQAVFANNGDEAAEFTAEYYACGKKAGTERLRIEAKQSRTTSFTWTSPAKAGTYTLKIQALPVEGESNTDNNSKTVNVAVKSPNYCKPDCIFASKYGENWDETYTWQIRHSDTCTGKDGQEYDCSWTEICSETVAYSESLEAILTVNTKQGIPTDRQNPRESDRESRGSWEIIPYARANGLDPNEVTRAGYGFEVKVQTTYKTDWETKVPGPADPHGGAYRGPYKVLAQFYDTTMTEVEEIELEATSGQPGDRVITWEIPLSRFDFSDGSYAWVRKHYTDVRNKDGRYAVRVIVEPCGRGQLSICRDKYIMIYGDMYDDIYTRPATAEEW